MITQKFLESLGFVVGDDLHMIRILNEPSDDGSCPAEVVGIIRIDKNRWGCEIRKANQEWCDGIGFGNFTTQAEIKVLCALLWSRA